MQRRVHARIPENRGYFLTAEFTNRKIRTGAIVSFVYFNGMRERRNTHD